MNKTISGIRYSFLLACILLMGSINAIAQDANTQSHTTTTQTTSSTSPVVDTADWMNNPWVWAGAGVVVLLLLIAIFSGKSKSNSRQQVSRTTTVTTEVKND